MARLSKYHYEKRGLLHGLLTKDCLELDGRLIVWTRVRGYRAHFEDERGTIDLFPDGRLVLHKKYRWDGASGPTWDTITTMRGSAVHDALYRLIAAGKLPRKLKWKADAELYIIMREDEAYWARAAYYMVCVEIFGGLHLPTPRKRRAA